MIRLAGALLVLAMGALAAYGAARAEKRRLEVLEGWVDLIMYIRGQIDCFLTPLDEILQNCDRRVLDACLAPENARDLETVLAASLPYLDADARHLLERFLREVGTSYREEQLKRCDYYLNALSVLREKRAAELPVRRRLLTSLSLCAAIGTAILLW